MNTIILKLAALLLAQPTGDVLAPWSTSHHPTDMAKRHVEEITEGGSRYVVVQGGTMDGRNCRSPQGVWQPFEQTWESNRSVRMENVGDTDVVNPWLSNGQNDFRSLERIVAKAIEPRMSASQKAMALWWQEVGHRFHWEGSNDELLDPVKVFNVYGHNTCGNDSICLAGLWKTAGFKVAPARLVGHCVSQVFYEGAWHLFDGDMQSVYLLRDNETVAGEQDLVRDHDLIRRTHTQGILQPDARTGDEWESSIYVFEGVVTGDRSSAQSALKMTLRPGESIQWRWGHLNPIKYHAPRPPQFPDRVCNGLWEYRPDFLKPSWRRGATTIESIRDEDGRLLADGGKTGIVVWSISSPYVLVGGSLQAEGSGFEFQLSFDGRAWHDVDRDLDKLFPPNGPARYRYFVRCALKGNAVLRRLAIVNDLQMAPLTLPEMAVGFEYVHIHRRIRNRASSADQPRLGRAIREPASGPAERSTLSAIRRDQRRHRCRLSVAARDRPRRRRDCRLPLRALRPRRHEVAGLDELRQTDLAHSRRRQGSLHPVEPRIAQSRHGVFLARPRAG